MEINIYKKYDTSQTTSHQRKHDENQIKETAEKYARRKFRVVTLKNKTTIATATYFMHFNVDFVQYSFHQ